MHIYTNKQKIFLTENVKGKRTEELTKIFNEHFDLDLNTNQIRVYKKNHKLKSELDTRYKKDNIPHNKGKKRTWKGGEGTQFKKGHTPHNHLPIGTERVNGDDYVDIKIANPNKWRGKHILIWEEHNGKVPDGCCIIFGDGNNRNFDINNLICVTRAQLIILNNNKLIKDNAELTKIGKNIADVKLKIGEIKRRNN